MAQAVPQLLHSLTKHYEERCKHKDLTSSFTLFLNIYIQFGIWKNFRWYYYIFFSYSNLNYLSDFSSFPELGGSLFFFNYNIYIFFHESSSKGKMMLFLKTKNNMPLHILCTEKYRMKSFYLGSQWWKVLLEMDVWWALKFDSVYLWWCENFILILCLFLQ